MTTDALRTVSHAYTTDDIETMLRVGGVDQQALDNAITRLSQWAMDSERYVRCTLHVSDPASSPEITAVYRNAAGDLTYVIGAVWHYDTPDGAAASHGSRPSGHFGFHS